MDIHNLWRCKIFYRRRTTAVLLLEISGLVVLEQYTCEIYMEVLVDSRRTLIVIQDASSHNSCSVGKKRASISILDLFELVALDDRKTWYFRTRHSKIIVGCLFEYLGLGISHQQK